MTSSQRAEREVPWQPAQRTDWQFSPVKHHFDILLGKMLQPKEQSLEDVAVPYFKAQHVQWDKVLTEDLPTMWATPGEISSLRVRKGDLLVCEGGEVGRAAIVTEEPPKNCIIQNALHLVRPKQSGDVRFLRYLLQQAASHEWLNVLCNRATIAHFTAEKFSGMWIWAPPLPEQHAIADYLDRETSKIDALITEKERLLSLLAEKRRALITQAVTRGLNRDVSMRDSGVEWLGEIPGHWELKRLKFISPEITVGIVVTPAKYYEDSGVPCLRSLNVKETGLTNTDLVYISPESNELLSKSKVFTGDLVAVRSGQPGTTAIVDERFDGANCIDLIVIRRASSFDSYFLAYFLNSEAAIVQFSEGSGGAIQQHFNIETAKDLLIPLPPLLEQRKIVSMIAAETAKLGRLQQAAERTIALFH